MTHNLIAYWSHAETVRHNEVTEAETARHNLVVEQHNRDVLAESTRHNLVGEAETHRANLAYEMEMSRHNMAVEGETQRHNLVTETETERSNRANESIKRESNQIGWANVSLGYAQLAEVARHNAATEANQAAALAESIRHNMANESITAEYNQGRLAIDQANFVQRTIESDRNYEYNYDRLALEDRHLAETQRHNLETEKASKTSAISGAWVDTTRGLSNLADMVKPFIR